MCHLEIAFNYLAGWLHAARVIKRYVRKAVFPDISAQATFESLPVHNM